MNLATYARLRNWQMALRYLLVSDAKFNRKTFISKLHYTPDFVNPKTFAEKLQYLKMHYDNLLQNVCSDKFTVCEYVKQCGYPEILKELYQVCARPEDIDLSLMPDRFFIQCSHVQGCNFIVDKEDAAKLASIKKIYKVLLKRKHYKNLRENCYRNIVPRILCGEYLEQPGKPSLTDYKIYCFQGVARYFMVSYGEFEGTARNHKFDMDWHSIDKYFKSAETVSADMIERPKNFDKMVEIAEKLSAPFPHVRIDLYNLDGRIVFGEMTFYSAGGFVKVNSDEMNRQIGDWIDLDLYKDYLKA